MIDGIVARKLNVSSDFGSKLDTVADFIFMIVCVIKILPMIKLSIFIWIWIIIITIIKINDIILVFIYKKKFVDFHTILNKITGLLLFILPLTLQYIESTYSFIFIGVVATIAAIQENFYVII